MLNIRLNRVGRKNKVYFRVVVQEHTVAPGGRHVEVLGSYDPHAKQAVLKSDRITYWLSQGAQLSDTMHNLLVREGVIDAKKIAVKMKRPLSTEISADKAVKTEVTEEKVEEKVEASA